MESEIDRLRKKVENFPSPSSYNRLAELLHLEKADADAEVVCRKCIKEGAGLRPASTAQQETSHKSFVRKKKSVTFFFLLINR